MKQKKQKQPDHTIRKVAAFARPIAPWLGVAVLLSMGSVLCSVLAPGILGDLVQMLYDYWEAGRVGTVTDKLLPGLGVLMALYIGMNGLSWINMVLMNNIVSRHFCAELRIAISDKLKRLPVKYVDQTPVGDILARMTDDAGEMSGYIYQITDVWIQGLLQLGLITAMMLKEDWRLGLFVVVVTPGSIWLSSKIATLSEKEFDQSFEKGGQRSHVVEESFSNFATGKAYNLDGYLEEKHQRVNQEQTTSTIRAGFISASVQPIIALFNSLAYIVINLVGGWLILKGQASIAGVVTIVLYARQFSGPLEQIAYGFGQVERIKAAARRVFTVLDMEEEISAGVVPEGTTQGKVEFRDAQFSYDPVRKLIQDLNLTVEPGETVAIVGPTGAGKTTIVNLLMRFYDLDGGQILLDGADIAALGRDEVRSRIGMVLQDTWLFRGTIAENVAYGKPGATREEIEDACRRAHCDRFIRTMPQGYDTPVGEDQGNLSGGQKQLITIARALLADRPLLILDEATSNVDTRTEGMIQKAMDELMEGRTCFVVAHRLSTIVDADRILVMDGGRILEQGMHRELLEKKGFYHKLYTSQYAI